MKGGTPGGAQMPISQSDAVTMRACAATGRGLKALASCARKSCGANCRAMPSAIKQTTRGLRVDASVSLTKMSETKSPAASSDGERKKIHASVTKLKVSVQRSIF